jgi:hypothetical protein
VTLRSRQVCLALLALSIVAIAACEPEVGSEAWCERMDETPKGDWTANQAADYARHCLFE